MTRPTTHARLLARVKRLPSDYADFGGTVERWADGAKGYPDCSTGCRWAAWLEGELGGDWCVCIKPGAPREGLLTFGHQAGEGCWQPEKRRRGDG